MGAPDPVVDAVAMAVLRATGASAARVLTSDGDRVQVTAIAGSSSGWRLGEAVAADAENVGYALASGQPLSIAPKGRDGLAVLCVPCLHESEPVGALELVGEEPFGIEATDVAMLFAQVAGAAIAAGAPTGPGTPSARELASELERIESSDPIRYASLGRVIGALLS